MDSLRRAFGVFPPSNMEVSIENSGKLKRILHYGRVSRSGWLHLKRSLTSSQIPLEPIYLPLVPGAFDINT